MPWQPERSKLASTWLNFVGAGVVPGSPKKFFGPTHPRIRHKSLKVRRALAATPEVIDGRGQSPDPRWTPNDDAIRQQPDASFGPPSGG